MTTKKKAAKKKTSSRKKLSSQVKDKAKKKPRRNIKPRFYIPTGSTLLNLALTDMHDGGWAAGRMSHIVGDSTAGKSFVALSGCAELLYSGLFDNTLPYYDDAEAANQFNMKKLFGSKSELILAPEYAEDGSPVFSATVEEFHDNVLEKCIEGHPFLYILDSMDSIDTDDDAVKAEKDMKARKEGKKIKGSYGMGKAKANSDLLKRMCGRIEKTNSHLQIISQTRDDVNPVTFSTKTHSGGRALKFYATHQVWLAVVGTITKEVRGKKRVIGVNVRAKITKNKVTGKVREVDFPIYYDYGIDDIGSMVDWMVNEEFWGKKKQTIIAEDLDIQGTRQNLIKQIEDNDLEDKLKEVVGECWKELEDSLTTERKKKYS